MEELVGRAVRKAFPGFGTYGGVVESYDAEAGYFRVLYEDGDSEEVDAEEMAEMLVGPAMPPALQQTPPRGDAADRRPKKRRRGEEESPPLADGVILAVPAVGESSNGEIEPATPAESSGELVAGPAEKKRKASPAPESARPLRRSARQAKASARAAEMEAAAAVAAAADAAEAEAEAAAAGTPQKSGRKRPRANGNGRYRSVSKDLAEAAAERLSLKPELPQSSQGLDLGGLPVLDLFQVYSCLRSFTRQLFLSPFPLETFVAALHCTYVNPLIDWVHFALLRALKSHLEDFANEGDPFAIHCIRNLNWELLDLATWPIFLAEYVLTRGSELRYGMKLTDLKPLSTEYYRQPAVVKLELLRSLSDDVLEIGAVRSRMSESDGNDEGFRSSGLRRKRRGSSAKGGVDSSLPPEGSDDMDDGNSDECFLCGMDGNLLCCDGCPAAFHSKCVGVVEDLLPEGDWYCPECLIQKNDGSRNMTNSMRGAEVLGIDPHGRLYFGTCGYLLVVDSCTVESPCHYYGQNDLHSLVTVLNSCHPSYSSVVNAISLFCGIAIASPNFNGRYQSSKECSTSDAETDCRHLSPLKQPSEYEQFKVEQDNSFEHLSGSGNETTAEEVSSQTPQNRSASSKNGHCDSQQDVTCSHANGLSAKNQKDPSPRKKPSDCHLHLDPARYINYYSFGQIAASAAEELKHKLSENKEGKKPVQDALSFHLRTICKKYANIFALTDQKLSVELLKEKCGWCNCCQISGGVDCIFRVTDAKFMQGPKPHAFDLRAEKNKESHIVLAMHNILSIEERLNGLLTGPWQNPQYSDFWRKAVLKASDVSSLKQPLLMLESSLRRVAISVEWHRPADSVEVVGSAAHILVRSSNKSLSHGSAKKPGRKPSSNGELKVDSRDVGVYWWRGGELSRQVFHWKRLPQSLAYKAARQAGRRKIPTILYPDGSQFARRFKYIAWRAAVEMAENVAQLILQIKELEWNIKWTEILSTLPSSLATKETQKIARLFKKVIIRRKRIEGTNVEYLLDFGKRENIPPVVSKHGTKFEEPSNERNRYWLSEGHVPLNLLKAYEAKALARLLKKREADDLPKKTKKMRDSKPQKLKRSGFDYLFEKAKKLSIRLCGHCNKVVIASEAVNCQYCAALFHKRHFKVPRGAADAIYVCNKCLAEKVLKVKSPQKKAAPKRTSPRKKQKKQSHKIVTRRNQIVFKYKKTGKKGKRGRPRKNPLNLSKKESPKMPESEPSNVPKNEQVKRISRRLYDKYMKGNSNISEQAASCSKRRRTALHYSYWLNGLQWTQNPDDERARSFRKERVVFPSEDAETSEVSPVCCLCEKCYSEEAIYIACEKCEDWFHGDIYSITLENVNTLIGFKCHKCRLRDVPVCPYAQNGTILEAQSDEEHCINKFVEDEDHNCPEDLGAYGNQKDLQDHNIDKRFSGHITEKELKDHDCLKELNHHSNLKEVGSHSTGKELDDEKSLEELDAHKKLKELDSPGSKEPDAHNCLKGLDYHSNLKELDSYSAEKELKNHHCLNELDSHNNLNELGNHNSREELDGTESSKFAVEETQCMEELDSFDSLKLDNHNILEELDNHNCPKESNNHNSSKELDNNQSPEEFDSTEGSKFASATTHSGDFLAEHFSNIRISGKEALIITSETGSVKESLALQSKDDSENSVPAEHDIDIQVVVTL
ncbi:DDT domain-containing protein PTM-like [Phragmites australis]|uniref:DDT domain-containing protein PTM-like n=1 Tax=Phragmites australis TaxID=29695 RepID=UPI002D788B68|nr:DDT domain-containing protein PTM-like [Phragmites australis]